MTESTMESATYRLADTLLGGQLGAMLTGWQEQGLSYREMQRRLKAVNVEVSHGTVHRWCNPEEA